MHADRTTLGLIAEVAQNKGYIELPAQGGSMYPFIRDGEVCRFLPCRASALKRGDVVLFRSADGRLIAHRYCRSFPIGGERRYVCKGDTNGGFDDPIGPESILGRLTAIKRNGTFHSVSGLEGRLWSWSIVRFPRLFGFIRSSIWVRMKLQGPYRPVSTPGAVRAAYRLVRPYVLRYWKGYTALLALLLGDIVLTLAFAWLFGSLLDAAVHGHLSQLKRLMPIGAALFLTSAASAYWNTYFEAYVVNGIKQEMTEDLYKHMLLLPISGMSDVRSGEWLTHFTNEIHGIDGMVGRGLIALVRLPLTYGTVFLYLLHINGRLALLSFIAAPLAIAAGAVFGLLLRRSGRSILRLWGEASTLLNETFHGLFVIRSFTREALFFERFVRYNRELYALELGNARLNGLFRAGGYGVSAAAYLMSLGMGAYSIVQGTMSVGALLTFLNLVHYLIDPLTGLAGQWAGFQRSVAAMERLSAVFAQSPESTELPSPLPGKPVHGSIRFEQVTFRYEGFPPLFERLDLSLPAGKTVAIVGPSGAGKTTLLHLLQGFYKPQSGCIRIDGAPIEMRSPSELRSLFAHVSQDTFLFAGTVRDNLLLARPGITQTELVKAAVDAHIHEFIVSLPHGYDTEIGERGIRLSGGQKQRIAIARALLKNAPILLLDEATSALDSETELEVKRALERLMKHRTTLLVTHRWSMTEQADMIVTLDQGRIVDPIGEVAAYDGPASRSL